MAARREACHTSSVKQHPQQCHRIIACFGCLCTQTKCNCFCNVEPEEEEQAVAKEEEEKQKAAQQGDNTGAQESMQIEEVSLQEGQQGNDSSSQQGDSGGVVGAMMGAAKSLFGGGKHDEQVCLLLLPYETSCTGTDQVKLQSWYHTLLQCKSSAKQAPNCLCWPEDICPPALQQWPGLV